VCLNSESVITTKFYNYTATYRRSAEGLVMQLLREHHRTLARQSAKRRYHSERRSALYNCAAGQLRPVGVDVIVGTAAYKRAGVHCG
jgi:hypothetical protein